MPKGTKVAPPQQSKLEESWRSKDKRNKDKTDTKIMSDDANEASTSGKYTFVVSVASLTKVGESSKRKKPQSTAQGEAFMHSMVLLLSPKRVCYLQNNLLNPRSAEYSILTRRQVPD